MPRVTFTRHLRRFFADLEEIEVKGNTVADIVTELNRRFPGLSGYLTDEQGRLRKHVNIFVGNSLVRDRHALSDEVETDDTIHIIQALSGG